jgi:hypothetical protein
MSLTEYKLKMSSIESRINILTELIEEMYETNIAQCKRIKEQDILIKEQAEQLKRTKNAVYQLIGGLYNHQEQNYPLKYHIAMLFGNELPKQPEEYTFDDMYPTTRQGDDQAERIKALEERLMLLEKK